MGRVGQGWHDSWACVPPHPKPHFIVLGGGGDTACIRLIERPLADIG